ncbi:phosphomevalonate kinase [Nocardia halotolerans]|uniref:phosphomevalonate kinase n=1 Tax=Nocardia halotolerans TaxID=1755878 RepID=A0ABV8VE00_9NOCA
MISTRAPGKLFIAGEYAVVEPGHHAILVAVDRYASATVVPAAGDTVLGTDLDGGATLACRRHGDRLAAAAADPVGRTHHRVSAGAAAWEPGSVAGADGAVHRGAAPAVPSAGPAEVAACTEPGATAVPAAFAYLFAVASIIDRLVAEREIPARAYRLDVTADLGDADGRKFGLGASAAVTGAAVAALGEFYGLDLNPMDRYRLAMLATVEVNPRASGGDVAASTWGGWIAYSSPDRGRVAEVAAAAGVDAALRMPWPGLSVRPLPAPTALELLVGWTGTPASTPALVAGMSSRPQQPADRTDFRAHSNACVERLSAALAADDPSAIRTEIDCARELLLELDTVAGVGIMTDRLTALCAAATAVGAAAKPSGAGGGDCGIALIDSAETAAIADLTDRWAAAGIRTLPLRTHPYEGQRA